MGKITVAIVDDNVRMQNLIEEILKEDPEIEVIGKAENGLEALTIITDKKPDVVLLDLIMPKLDGVGVMERIIFSVSCVLRNCKKIVRTSALNLGSSLNASIRLCKFFKSGNRSR